MRPGQTWKQEVHLTPLQKGALNLSNVFVKDDWGNIYGFLQYYSVFVTEEEQEEEEKVGEEQEQEGEGEGEEMK